MTSRTISTGTSNAQGLPLHSLVHCSLSRDFYFAFISENAAAIALKCTPHPIRTRDTDFPFLETIQQFPGRAPAGLCWGQELIFHPLTLDSGWPPPLQSGARPQSTGVNCSFSKAQGHCDKGCGTHMRSAGA